MDQWDEGNCKAIDNSPLGCGTDHVIAQHPCQVICAAVCSSSAVKWRSHLIILWAVGDTLSCNCYRWGEQMLRMKRQKKNQQPFPSQKHAVGKSYIAEWMEARIKTTYFSLTPVLCWFLGIHPVFLHYKFPIRPALDKLESFFLGLSIISSCFLFSLPQPQEQCDLTMLNHTLSRSDFLQLALPTGSNQLKQQLCVAWPSPWDGAVLFPSGASFSFWAGHSGLLCIVWELIGRRNLSIAHGLWSWFLSTKMKNMNISLLGIRQDKGSLGWRSQKCSLCTFYKSFFSLKPQAVTPHAAPSSALTTPAPECWDHHSCWGPNTTSHAQTNIPQNM